MYWFYGGTRDLYYPVLQCLGRARPVYNQDLLRSFVWKFHQKLWCEAVVDTSFQLSWGSSCCVWWLSSMASSPWQFSAVAVDVTMTLVVWDILRATLCVAPIVIPCYCFLDGIDHIGGGTWWDNLVWNHSSGIEKWPRPHEHPAGMKCGFGLGQTLPSGFGDGNMVDRKGGISRIFTCFHQEEQTYSVIQLHIKSRHVHWRKESKVAAWWYCGDPIYSWQWCMLGDVRLWFRGWVDQRSWKGSPLRIQVNCFTRLRSVSFSWFQNYPAKTTVGVFFKAGLALIKTSGLPGLWSSPYTPLL